MMKIVIRVAGGVLLFVAGYYLKSAIGWLNVLNEPATVDEDRLVALSGSKCSDVKLSFDEVRGLAETLHVDFDASPTEKYPISVCGRRFSGLDSYVQGLASLRDVNEGQAIRIDFYGQLDAFLNKGVRPTFSVWIWNLGSGMFVFDGFNQRLFSYGVEGRGKVSEVQRK